MELKTILAKFERRGGCDGCAEVPFGFEGVERGSVAATRAGFLNWLYKRTVSGKKGVQVGRGLTRWGDWWG